MSTPTPDEPTTEALAAPAAEPPAAPPPPASSPAPPPPVPPAVPPAAFAPVPREPWINPRRRTQVAGIGLVAALACIGAGIGIGFAASGDDHRDRPHGIVLMPGRGFGYDPAIYGPGLAVPHGRFGVWPVPGGPYDNNGGSATPSPAPSSTG
jgi:hypothetical protein